MAELTQASSLREGCEASPKYTGWLVVLAAFFGVMVSFAVPVPYTFSLFITPLHDAFGWKRQGISLAFGITAMPLLAQHAIDAHDWRAASAALTD